MTKDGNMNAVCVTEPEKQKKMKRNLFEFWPWMKIIDCWINEIPGTKQSFLPSLSTMIVPSQMIEENKINDFLKEYEQYIMKDINVSTGVGNITALIMYEVVLLNE